LYQIYKFLVYIPWLLLWTLVNFLGVVAVAPFSQQKASRWFGGAWGRGLLRGVPAGLRILGEENLDQQQSYIVVANHLSLMDIPILYGWLKLDLKWVMKKELRKVPMIGGGCALMGHIFLDRSDRQAAIRELEAVKERMLPGTSILFFPEGTRARDGQLQDFKMGAFRMARDLDIPVLPITIRGTDAILTPDGMDLHPGRAEMIIHAPIPVQQVRDVDPEILRDSARSQIASALPV
jgi:1-acyl-sn-glycerol-3-phosphate acyltransferase